MVNLVVLTNSPGEVVGWVKPVINEFKRRVPEGRVYVFVPPCQYASGLERQVVRELPQVDGVWGVLSLLKLILFGIRPPGFELSGTTIVLHLGSDLLYSAWLAKRLQAPAYACTDGFVKCVSAFECFFVADEQKVQQLVRKGVPADKVAAIGHLFYEAVDETPADMESVRQEWGLDAETTVIGILPGSKPYQLCYDLAFLLKVAQTVHKRYPSLQFIMSKSAYTRWEDFQSALGEKRQYALDGVDGKLEYDNDQGILRTEGGVEIIIRENRSLELMRTCQFLISVPGTNQIEAAVLGVPSIVIIPLNEPEAIPLDGLLHHLPKIPIIGKLLKRKLVLKYSENMPFVTLPNRLARKMIIPELRGVLTAKLVADKVFELLEHPELVKKMSGELLKLTAHEEKPSGKLVEIILNSRDRR